MAKLGFLFLNRGLYRGNRIISESWIQESVQRRMTTFVTSIGWLNGYGYQWWTGDEVINGRNIHMYAAWGNGGQVIAVFPDLDLVVVFTGGCFDDAARPFRIMRDRLIPIVVS
jgi:CubicO group peptidase (beta-lactamase class C family)